jgi:hypothetical protein
MDLEEVAMTPRGSVVALGVLLLAGAGQVRAGDDHAVHRGGGDSGSHSSSAGDRHPSDSGHSSSSSSSSGYQGSPQGASGRTGAELRHPRPGTGTGHAYYHGSPYYYPYYYGYGGYGYGYPYGFYGAFGYGYSPYYYSGYYGYSPYYYGSGHTAYGYGAGSLRLLVEPNQTRVYVDGYYAGTVDDFDGIFQRLYLSPGRHDVTLKLEGFRTYKVRVYVPVDQTVKIHYRMVAGAGTEVDEATVGVPPIDDETRSDARRDAPPDQGYEPRPDQGYEPRPDQRYEPREDEPEAPAPRDQAPDQGDRGGVGTLRLQVRPGDASVYVDGDFRGTAQQMGALTLPAGKHRIEIVRPGFQTVDREVEVRPGRTTTMEADLGR